MNREITQMFTSVNSGYLPVCVLVLVAAWFISSLRNPPKRVLLTVIAPIVISLAWFFLPGLFHSLGPIEVPWVIWGFMSSAIWSGVALPLSIVAVLIFVKLRRKIYEKNEN